MDFHRLSDQLIDWLCDYSQQSNTKGFVVGVSGGIDSAVVATLCAKTGLPTWLVQLPIHQATEENTRGAQQIHQLQSQHPKNVYALTTDLSVAFDIFTAALPQEARFPLNLANLRSRLRMCALYAIAGQHNALVVGTGNKVEDFGVGFFTKYGDGGVDISPIADLYKSEVFALGQHLGVIPDILVAAPTDGLFAGSPTDEEQLGATYDELEWAMRDANPADYSHFSERQKIVWNIYQERHRKNQHKMNPIPVFIIPRGK